MPLVERLPVGTGCAQWSVWGTVARIVVTDPARLDAATDLVRAELAAVDEACSRFRTDSEVRDVFRAHGGPITVSVRLAELVRAALDSAVDTDGDVDPTLGLAMSALGYDRDFAEITAERVGYAPERHRVRDRRLAQRTSGRARADRAGRRAAGPRRDG